MKRLTILLALATTFVAAAQTQKITVTIENDATSSIAQPRRVALVVQNHTSNTPSLPMAAFADTLTARLSGKTFRVVNPHNAIGVSQNSTAEGEAMPKASAQEIGRMLNAEGVITASIQEFTSEVLDAEGSMYKFKVRLALNLASAATGETLCGVDGVEFCKKYTANKAKSNAATLYEGLLHAAAAKGAEALLAKAGSVCWPPVPPMNLLRVFFGCNVLGADIQIDGFSYGTCPAQLAVTPGAHHLVVSYPPYYHKFERRVMFNQEWQTYQVVLQLTPQGEEQRKRTLEYEQKLLELKNAGRAGDLDYEKKRKCLEAEQRERCGLFKKQLALADAMLERYKLSGETDDYVRRTVATGTAVYWQNSFGRIAITQGSTDNIEFATPVTKTGNLIVPPGPADIGQGLQNLLMKRPGEK